MHESVTNKGFANKSSDGNQPQFHHLYMEFENMKVPVKTIPEICVHFMYTLNIVLEQRIGHEFTYDVK